MKKIITIVVILISSLASSQIIKSSSNHNGLVITNKGVIVAIDDTSSLTLDLDHKTVMLESNGEVYNYNLIKKSNDNKLFGATTDDNEQTILIAIDENKVELYVGELIYTTHIL